MFWVISVYFNIRNTLPEFCPFLLGHPVYTGCPRRKGQNFGSVPYVKIYGYNPKHLYSKLNSYGDNRQRKVWSSGGSMHCTLSADILSHVWLRLPCQITEIPLMLLRQYSTMADCMSCIVLGTLKDNYDMSAGFFVVQFNGFMSLTS